MTTLINVKQTGQVSPRPFAAIPVENNNPCCSCKLTQRPDPAGQELAIPLVGRAVRLQVTCARAALLWLVAGRWVVVARPASRCRQSGTKERAPQVD